MSCLKKKINKNIKISFVIWDIVISNMNCEWEIQKISLLNSFLTVGVLDKYGA